AAGTPRPEEGTPSGCGTLLCGATAGTCRAGGVGNRSGSVVRPPVRQQFVHVERHQVEGRAGEAGADGGADTGVDVVDDAAQLRLGTGPARLAECVRGVLPGLESCRGGRGAPVGALRPLV